MYYYKQVIFVDYNYISMNCLESVRIIFQEIKYRDDSSYINPLTYNDHEVTSRNNSLECKQDCSDGNNIILT